MTDFQVRIIEICNSFGGQSGLARKSGLHTNTICKWCNGKAMPTAAALISLARNCGLSADYVLGIEELEKAEAEDEDDAWMGCLLHGQM